MQSVTTIGFDIAKSVFQVHGIGGEGEVVIRRQLKRRHVLVFFQKLPRALLGVGKPVLWRSTSPARRPPGFIQPCVPTLGHAMPAGPQ